jgi:cytochrome c-type biogenesis protein CcmH/NrfF
MKSLSLKNAIVGTWPVVSAARTGPSDPSLTLPVVGEGIGCDTCCALACDHVFAASNHNQQDLALVASFSKMQLMKSQSNSAGWLPCTSTGRGWGWDLAIVFIVCLALVSPLSAQQTPIDPTPTTATSLDATAAPRQFGSVTFDDVNRVAAGMYCPECEYIPLDKCYSPVCVQWKEEIAVQLAEGRTEQQIIDGFVARFGDQVLGIPQDENLRNLSIYVPYVALVVIVIVGVLTFLRWSRRRPMPAAADANTTAAPSSSEADAGYRSLLERDLDRS